VRAEQATSSLLFWPQPEPC